MSTLKLLCLTVLCHLTLGENKQPTIFAVVLARNKAHTLPYFLTLFENLNYPKDRISLWIRSDHNSDNTDEVLSLWVESVKDKYHSVNYVSNGTDGKSFSDEIGPAHWPPSRFTHVIGLREKGLELARKRWADYILQIDCDVLLTNPDTLRHLVNKSLPIVAPMLKSDGLYSNFWSGMTSEYYYQRTDQYKPLLNREEVGCFKVPMVHSCILADLRDARSDFLTYDLAKLKDYDGPHDDIITFALSANRSGVEMHVCNDKTFGYVPVPLEQADPLSHDFLQLVNVKLEALAEGAPVDIWTNISQPLQEFVSLPEKDLLGFDAVYMINLLRRPERRQRMQACFDELGIEAIIVDAVDGKTLNESVLSSIQVMPDYSDPYHGRTMTLGEIGCFLSHYGIWKRVVEEELELVLVLEDDIRFEPFFRARVQRLLEELDQLESWDLVYLGRKRLQDQDEPWVEGSKMLVHVGYSYWTLGYALTLEGARKLLEPHPLKKLVPVDEYLPILFDRHPRTTWKDYYPTRNLKAFSASPLLLFPTHYTGDTGYISDTEDSAIITNVVDEHIHGDL